MSPNHTSKRIAIICGAGMVSGKEIMVLELARGLREQGHTVELVTSLWNNGDFVNRLRTMKFPAHVLRIGFISATLSLDCLRMTAHQALHWPGLLLGYGRFLRRHNPKRIIHTNWHHLLLLWPFLKPERDLFWLHEVVPDKPQYRQVFRFLGRRLQCFVVVSHAVARSLETIGIPHNQIRVVHNGLTDPVPESTNNASQSGVIRLGIVGQVGPWKGHEDILAAFAMIAAQNSMAELHIFGSGPLAFESQLKTQASKLGLSARLTWHGFITDQKKVYSAMDLCVVPSRSPDPLPTTAIEAGFFSLPVVATRRGGLPEIIEDGVTGLLVQANDSVDLAEKIQSLIGNPHRAREMGKAARQRALKHFSVQRMTADFDALL